MSRHRCGPGRLVRGVLGMLLLSLPGCALFTPSATSSHQGSAFSWLTNWVNQPLEGDAGFDVEKLRPDPSPATVDAGDLLEITVWDLDEPGKPYTFPVRVSEQRMIEAPLVGQVSVADQSREQIEQELARAYVAREYLVDPRILVRSLDPPSIKVQVSGAVQRPGFVELARSQCSVHAALISCGGLKKPAGHQVAIVCPASQPVVSPHAPTPPVEVHPTAEVRPTADAPAEQYANTVHGLSVDVPSDSPTAAIAPAAAESAVRAVRADPRAGATADSKVRAVTVWYDLTRDEDREALRNIRLREGDEVIVKGALPPVRVGGVVRQPGAFPVPPGRSLNVWQAIEMAGGVSVHDAPLNITLIHPAAEGRAAQRTSLHVPEYDQHPPQSPLLEPGDILHVEPTTGSKLKRAVGDLWSKP
ncbi:MAG: polysaccharide biosynthesis/export family protein [Planctomycetales bacterium]